MFVMNFAKPGPTILYFHNYLSLVKTHWPSWQFLIILLLWQWLYRTSSCITWLTLSERESLCSTSFISATIIHELAALMTFFISFNHSIYCTAVNMTGQSFWVKHMHSHTHNYSYTLHTQQPLVDHVSFFSVSIRNMCVIIQYKHLYTYTLIFSNTLPSTLKHLCFWSSCYRTWANCFLSAALFGKYTLH